MQYIIGAIVLYLLFRFWKREQRQKRLRYIENYKFHPALLKRVQKQHDYLSDKDMEKVAEATRDYFYICSQANGRMVAMPSEIVDVLWHEFLLFTRQYEEFCQKGIGRFLHHTPTEAMKSKTVAQEGIKRAWRLACLKANIDPFNAKKLPLLFVIDKSLNIKGGFKYDLNCKSKATGTSGGSCGGASCGGYCATDIACTSSCGGGSFGGDSGGFSCGGSSSDGGGSSCGGGGCGGS